MNYEEKVIEFLKDNMTDRGFKLWSAINNRIPNVWNKLSSSSQKYHKKAEGYVPNIAEHTYEMLFAASKIMKMFNYNPKTTDADVLFFALALHDSLKYGEKGDRDHTTGEHDKLAGDMISTNKETFQKILTESQVQVLEDSVRYHSGQWSTDAKGTDFNFSDRDPIAMFVHILDMLSTADLIKMPKI